jgi:deoxyadenosine/deoxycytidine kinase
MKIVIDGNIGSGKTTQLDLLERAGHKVQREPIAEWPLEEFYNDPSRWAFLLHMAILKTLQPVEGTVVYERCLLSSRWVFWQYMLDRGHVTEDENKVYKYFYEKFLWQPDVYIFILKSPELAWEHVQARHQTGDSGVTYEYLVELDRYYKDMLANLPLTVHFVDGSDTPENIHEKIVGILQWKEGAGTPQ